jgi:hypothetical protein
MSPFRTSLPKRYAALCLELAKADVYLTGIRPGSLTEQMQRRAQAHRRRAVALLSPSATL